MRPIFILLAILGPVSQLNAAFEVIRIVRAGEEVTEQHAEHRNWPAQTLALVNAPQRTDGWHSVFSGLRIESEEYELTPTSEDDVQSLVDAFARIESKQKTIQLSPLREPSVIGMAPVRRNVLKLLERRANPLNGPFTEIYGGKGTAAVLVVPNNFNRTAVEEEQIRKVLPHRVRVRHPILILFAANPHVNLRKLQFPREIALERLAAGPHEQVSQDVENEIAAVIREHPSSQNGTEDVVTAWGKPVASLQAGVRCRRQDLIVRGRLSSQVEIVLRNVSDAVVMIPAAPALMKSRTTGYFSFPGTDDLKVLAGDVKPSPDVEPDEVLTQVRESYAAAEEELGSEFGIRYHIDGSTLTGYYIAWDVLTRNRKLQPEEIVVVGKMFVEYQRPLSQKLVAGPDNVEPLRRQGVFHVGCDIPFNGHHRPPLSSGYLDFDVGP